MHYEQLDPLTAPLDGLRLIEASAGTGKTWVIAALYVRAVLGHGGQPPRMPPEILVVTFTRDATAELRERIRGRLEEAAAAFHAGTAADPFLARLLATYDDTDARARAARQLEVAAQWMDEAAIHTIHGWANRTLTRYAFDSGRAFGDAAEADQRAHVAEACRDYWRREVYPLAAPDFERVRDLFPEGPDELATVMMRLIGKHLTATVEGGGAPRLTLAASLEAAFAGPLAALQAEREAWTAHCAALQKLQPILKDALKGNFKAGKNLGEWITALGRWASGEPLTLSTDDLRALGQDALAGILKAGKTLPACEAYAAAVRLADILEGMPSPLPVVLRHALEVLPPAIARAKERRGEIGFDDMLSELHRALSGPQGAHLAAALRAQLPLALIDEFQDTDPLQWAIFEAIYANGGNLLLIGDPKQSIYGFRGADISTYFRARGAAASPALTLPRNFRATEPLVRAVNTLFARADDITPEGAFGYGKDEGGLRFQPVEAQGRPEHLIEDGAVAPALVLALPPGGDTLNKGAYQELMADAAGERVATWLVDGATARIRDGSGGERRVRPADIAVLVRTGSEADRVRAALRRRGLASVYLSDRLSVFATDEAGDLLHWLAALAEPGSDRALRAALATGSAGYAYAEIDRVGQDDLARDALIDLFTTASRLWRQRGILAAVRHLIHGLHVPARLASQDDAERRLTNLLHVAELLQQAAVHLDGEHALIRYLDDAIQRHAETDGDSSGAAIQRLESEADLVRVVTVHKSKGLQYPLVVMPFASSFRDIADSDSAVEFERDGERILSLEPDAKAIDAARQARVREEVRLFYVAVTRAELACWIGAAAVEDGQSRVNGAPLSGLGRLLGGGADLSGAQVREAAEALRAKESAIALVTLPAEIPLTRTRGLPPVPTIAEALVVQAPRAPAWWLSSYSALVRGPGRGGVDAGSAAEAVPLEEYREARPVVATEAPAADMHAFPRGPAFGSFLHYLLEWAALVGFERVCQDGERTRAEIARRAATAGLSEWNDVLSTWLPGFLSAPLPLPAGDHVALRQLAPARLRPEFAFMVEAKSVRLAQLDEIVTRHVFPGLARPPLTQSHVNGLLSGFIDLVFEHGGAWYTLDYKSNHLAPTSAGYTEAVMAEEMLAHRYDLQAALYLLALHRFLRARRADYDPARHIGGVVYPFLRGIGEGTGVVVARPAVAMLDALDALFAGEVAHAA